MLVIAAFPGTGKEYLYRTYNKRKLDLIDLDSCGLDKVRFPRNFVDYITIASRKHDGVLVDSRKEVRRTLARRNIKFTLVYPAITLRSEYLKRYEQRGRPQQFIDSMRDNWVDLITEMQDVSGCEHYVLNAGEFIADVFDSIYESDNQLIKS